MSSRSRSTSALIDEAHLFLGETAHFEQPRLELFQLFLKVTSVTLHGLHYPNRPVT